MPYDNKMYEQLFLTLNSIKNNFLLTFKKKVFFTIKAYNSIQDDFIFLGLKH